MKSVSQHSTETYQTPTTAVVSALAAVKGSDEMGMTPLYQSINPDALNALFNSGTREARVVFEHAGCTVEVGSDGTITVTPLEE